MWSKRKRACIVCPFYIKLVFFRAVLFLFCYFAALEIPLDFLLIIEINKHTK